MLDSKKIKIAVVMLVSLVAGSGSKAADLELVGREMVRMLQDGHYARLPFNEQMSARFLERYMTALDDQRLYFLAGEVIDLRRRYERRLHDYISTRQVLPVVTMIFERYRQRVMERAQYSRRMIKQKAFSFDDDRKILRDRSRAEWETGAPALEKLWQERLELQMLDELMRRKRLQGWARNLEQPDPFRDQPTVESSLLKKFERLEETVKRMGREDIARVWFSAIANSYDPHSDYLSENEMAQFRIDVSNELVGIGARLLMNDDGETVVKELVGGGPAERAGKLRAGDRIFEVSARNNGEWRDISFMPLRKVIEFILGEEGEAVGLKVRRKSQEGDLVLEISIPRGVVTIKDELVRAWIYDFEAEDGPGKLAVLTIPSFYFDFGRGGNRVSVHVEQLLARLKKEGITGLVLDLRNNSGGSLPEVQRLTGFFVGQGPVVQVRASNGQVLSLDSLHRTPLYDGPLVVLVNEASASAAEILAAALQDYHRGVLVGAPSTFGKGTVQKTNDIADFMPVFSDRDRAGWLKLTFQKYYRVSGSSVQARGVVPDLLLPATAAEPAGGEGSRKYALPHDVIRASDKFQPGDQAKLFLPILRKKSAARLAGPSLFTLPVDGEEPESNERVSLNLPERMRELAKNEERRRAAEVKRNELFEKIRAADREKFTVSRLTLDDLKREELPEDEREEQARADREKAGDEIAVLEGAVIWPGGIDAYERESLDVLQDLIASEAPARTGDD